MKNLPDKIWLSEDRTMWLHNPYSTEYTEYVRKDAFIEKVCEGIEHLLSGYIIRNFHFGDSYKIDTLIEDIKNYMKEE